MRVLVAQGVIVLRVKAELLQPFTPDCAAPIKHMDCVAASNIQKQEAVVWRKHGMLWTVFAILILLWLVGWGFHIAGSLIHLLVVVAIVVLLIQLITGRRAVV